MLSDDVAAQGFVLLCCGKPESDCAVRTVDEARARARGGACDACVRAWLACAYKRARNAARGSHARGTSVGATLRVARMRHKRASHAAPAARLSPCTTLNCVARASSPSPAAL